MKRYLLLLFALFITLSVYPQAVQPEIPEPSVLVTEFDGSTTELISGDEFSGEAPITLKLSANAEEVEGFSLVVVWTFKKEGETEPYLTRHDSEFEIDVKTSGAIIIQPEITYTSLENSDVVWPYGAEEFEPFRIILAESSLEVPNAFSPNGDGINDYFNVYNAKSIVSFHAAIFNRWGQQLYSWGLDGIDSKEAGWDGTYNGKPVKAGVYYVVVKAKGADGIEYEFRRDVNLLRGYDESGN